MNKNLTDVVKQIRDSVNINSTDFTKAKTEIKDTVYINKNKVNNKTMRIFNCVLKHPEKVSEIHKFMNYYLPITLKLVNTYKEFEIQKLKGDSIKTSKKEIQDTLDIINIAFENLLNNLYEKDIIDISADISVLQNIFAQEGLTGQDFKKEKK